MRVKRKAVTNPNVGFKISQSALGRFQDCRTKAALALEGWVPKVPSRPLLFGNFFHNCLAMVNVFINTNHRAPELEDLENMCNEEWEAFLNSPEAADKEACEHMQYDASVILVMLQNYVDHYYKHDSKVNWVNVEGRIDIEYGGNKLMGFLDGAFELHDGKELWVFETKTRAKEDLESLGRVLHMEFQTFYYIHLVYVKTGRIPNGICYNVVFKPSIRKGKHETMPEFLKRLDADIKKNRGSYFQRLNVSIDPSEYQRWKNDTLDPLLADYSRWATGSAPSYKNTASCNGKYGKCPYLEYCSLGSTVYLKKQEYGGRK